MPGRAPLALLLAGTAAVLGGCITPEAHFTVAPSPAQVGQPVAFDASSSKMTLQGARFNFDFGEGGGFARRNDTDKVDPRDTHTYTSPGVYTVAVQVANKGLLADTFVSDVTSQSLTVLGPSGAPVPGFTISPNPACSQGKVTFDASSSSDPGGAIVDYRWDLDGDGTFETDTFGKPTATRSDYGGTPSERKVALRVTDASGRSSDIDHALVIDDSICKGVPASAVSVAAVEHKARFRLSMGMRQTRRGAMVMSGKRMMISGFLGRGRASLRGLPPPLARVRSAPWVARLSAILDTKTKRLRVQGLALIDLGRRGHLCTSLAIGTRRGSGGSGQMKVLGGSGAARHIDGKAAYTGGAGLKGSIKVRGRIEMEQKAKGKGLTRACKALLPRR